MLYATARRRVIVAAASGLAGGVLVSLLGTWKTGVLFGWDTAAVVYMSGVWFDVRGTDTKATAEFASREDDSRASADLMLLGASVGSLVALLLVLAEAANSEGLVKLVLSGLAIVSVFLSWAVVHTVFMLHYSHLYFSEPIGGMDFHDDTDDTVVTYTDFAYVAFTIGMTFQVSDTELISRPIRRLALRHALVSYVFATVILATMINVIAGLVG